MEEVFVHKVYADLLDKYRKGEVVEVAAYCGKVWSPDLSINLAVTPRCPRCWPQFALAS